jgi:putative salt-induced outer membrane protein YdiY
LNYNWGDDYTFLVAESSYGWEDKKAFSDQTLAHLRHVITTGNLLQIELFTQFDYNKKRLLLARELIGAGLRFRLIKTELFKFRLGIAYMLENESYDLQSGSKHEIELTVHRLSSYGTFTIDIKENLSFVSITYFQPKIDEWNDNKVISENSLAVGLGAVVDLYLKFNLRYDSHPPDTIKNLDTASKLGLSFKF